MRKLIITSALSLLIIFAVTSVASASVYVRGYYKSNGTYVAPHYRSDPDSYFWNNYNSYGNVNPYTGSIGTKQQSYNYGYSAYRAPSYYNYSYDYYTPSYYSGYYYGW